MTYNGLFWLLIAGHLIGDFYLQPEKLAVKRRKDWRFRLLHCAIYAMCIALSMWPVAFKRGPWTAYLWVVVAVAGAHALIDWVKDVWFAPRYEGKPRAAFAMFMVDQGLHLAVILGVAMVFRVTIGRTLLNDWGEAARTWLLYYMVIGDSFRALSIVQYLCIFMAIGQPACMMLRLALTTEDRPQPLSEPYERAIGVMERVFVVLLLFVGEYLAIAAVVLVKLLACRGMSGQDDARARYYLAATFGSVLIAVVMAMLGQPDTSPPNDLREIMLQSAESGNG